MKFQTMNISLPQDLVKEADSLAKDLYKNRSELIRDALLTYIRKNQKWSGIIAEGKAAGRKMGIKSEEDAYKIAYEFRHGKKSS